VKQVEHLQKAAMLCMMSECAMDAPSAAEFASSVDKMVHFSSVSVCM